MGSQSLILLDTHVLVWLVNGDTRLGARAKRTIESRFAAARVAVSPISYWELALLAQEGRIALQRPVDAMRDELLESGFAEAPLDGDVAIEAARLQGLHGDPADRFIVATASRAGATLLTADARILEWDGSLRRQDARV